MIDMKNLSRLKKLDETHLPLRKASGRLMTRRSLTGLLPYSKSSSSQSQSH